MGLSVTCPGKSSIIQLLSVKRCQQFYSPSSTGHKRHRHILQGPRRRYVRFQALVFVLFLPGGGRNGESTKQPGTRGRGVIGVAIEIFHYSHHRINRNRKREDDSVAEIPEESNIIFCVYPLCMIMSSIFAFLWLFTDIFARNPKIVLVGCFVAAASMLIAGIIEMKHADMYIDLTVITDAQLLSHPIFLHNFALCLLSIFCMSIYLLQGWILFDYYFWIKEQRETSDDTEISDSGAETDTIEDSEDARKKKEAPGELDPIPTLETFPSFTVSEALICWSFQLHKYKKDQRNSIGCSLQNPVEEREERKTR